MVMNLHKAVWPADVPHELNLPDRTVVGNLKLTAETHPDLPAIHFYGTTRTYGEFWSDVENLAGYLQAELGVNKGDRVLLYMQNSPHFMIGYFAILRIDAVVVPVNPMSKAAELNHFVNDTGAHVALSGQELLPNITPFIGSDGLKGVIVATYAEMTDPQSDTRLPEPLASMTSDGIAGDGLILWRDALSANLPPKPATAGMDDLAVIPYSSGTTGQPKGCMHTNYSVQATAIGGVLWNPNEDKEVHLVSLPLFHVTGMQSSMNGPIITAGAMVIMTRWDRDVAAQLISKFKISRWRSISTMAIDLVNSDKLDSYDLSSLRGIGGGGAAMPEAIGKKLKDLCGQDYVEGYGMSETIAGTHINPVDAPKRQCLGIPVFEVDSRVIDIAEGRECGPGEVGEIIVNAPQVFQGYWGKPEATREAFIDFDGKRFLRTGDIGYFDDEGYFFMVDRIKRMINASGFKVWPAEVEALMHRHPDIAEVCVIGTPDERKGEAVKAVIVPKPSAKDTLTQETIVAWCRNEMAAYKCPTHVSFTDSLPKSGTGKVQWRVLTEQELEPQP